MTTARHWRAGAPTRGRSSERGSTSVSLIVALFVSAPVLIATFNGERSLTAGVITYAVVLAMVLLIDATTTLVWSHRPPSSQVHDANRARPTTPLPVGTTLRAEDPGPERPTGGAGSPDTER